MSEIVTILGFQAALAANGNVSLVDGLQRAILVVTHGLSDGTEPTAVSVGGIACTKLVHAPQTVNLNASFWYRLVDDLETSGNKVISITTTGSVSDVDAYVLGTVDPAAPVGPTYVNQGSAQASGSLNLSCLTDGMTIIGVTTGSGDSSTFSFTDAYTVADRTGARKGTGHMIQAAGSYTCLIDWSSTRGYCIGAVTFYPYHNPGGGDEFDSEDDF